MADDTKLVISIETILKGLDKTVRGLGTVEKQLKAVSNVKAQTAPAVAINRAALAAQRFALQQRRLEQSSRRLAIAQKNIEAANIRAATSYERARLAAQRLEHQQNRVGTSANRLSKSTSAFLGGVGGGLAALFGVSAISAVQRAGAAMLDYANKLETTQIAFTTMLGSAELATAHLKELQAFALKTPFQFSELIDASQRMQALGFNARQVVPLLNDIGNAVAAAGGGAERLDRVVLALSQMQSKGKVATQELNQLAEAGISGFKILEQATGKSRAELVKMVEQGKVSSKVFLDAFQKFSKQNFGGLMEAQAKTFSGAMSNIKDALLQTSNVAFKPLFERLSETAIKLADMATNSKEFQKNMETAGKEILRIWDEVGKLLRGVAEAWRVLLAATTAQIGLTIHSFLALVEAIKSALHMLEAFVAFAAGDFHAATRALIKANQAQKNALDELRQSVIASGAPWRELGKIMEETAARARKAATEIRIAAAEGAAAEGSRSSTGKVGVGIGLGAGIKPREGGVVEEQEKGASGIRNAQERLAQALADVSKASADQLTAIEKAKNDRLLRQNEQNFTLQLIAYRQYLNERARLTSNNIQLEIDEQRKIADIATEERDRLQKRGERKGAEGVRARAAAIAADAQRIKAETEINRLQEEQKALVTEIRHLTEESLQAQQRDVQQLRIEYAELTGNIEDALNAATDAKFLETLKSLSLAQDDLNRRLVLAKEIKDADAILEIENQQRVNQSQIETIERIVEHERALNRLRAAEEFITRAKQTQSDLEEQLAIEVEFRGLKETEAIKRRLEGEEKVKNSLLIARDIVQDTIDRLQSLGNIAPQGLLDFVRQVNLEIQSLGKLTFTEQFRLAEIEFSRIQDLLIDKITDVERAIRSRTISEVEGRLIIRRLNNEYVGDLERQLELLKQIAAQSNDENLQRAARAAEQSVKDTRAAADELKNFNAQLKSVAVDSFRDSLSQLFRDLRDDTESAAQDILNFFNNILTRVNDFIAENLAQRIAESLFPDPNAPKQEGGVLGFFKSVLGFGGGEEQVTAANTTATDANTEAINNLTTTFGGQAATAGGGLSGLFGGVSNLFGGGGGQGGEDGGGFLHELNNVVSGLGIDIGGVLGASAAAGSTVIDALNINSDWLAKVTDALQQNTQALQSESGGGLQGLAALFGGGGGGGDFATGDIISAAPKGRVIRVAEAGYDEAVLTTDPKYAARQAQILKQYLAKTKGLFGRFKIPEFAEGGWSSHDAEMNMLNSIAASRNPTQLTTVPDSLLAGAGEQRLFGVRVINQVTSRSAARPYVTSEEGVRDIINLISENAPEIGRRLGVR